jgi:hypothetical protein
MEEEYDALITNNTWDLVPCPVDSNVLIGKWIFKHKFNSVIFLHGFTQRPGVNYDETFNPIVQLATVHMVLSLAVSRS